MAEQVKKKEEEEQLEDMPLIELLRLVSGPSHRQEVDKVWIILGVLSQIG